jgi:tetratricopeptide (TPR) repeat protein/serine phosphatase RsbU (regulator of sigma subunit)
MIKKILLPLIFLFTCLVGRSQSTDSLVIALKNTSHDTSRCRILNELVETTPGDEWITYNERLEAICTARLKALPVDDPLCPFFQKYLAAAYNNKALFYMESGKSKEALAYYDKSIQIREALHDEKGLSETYVNLGLQSNAIGDLKKSLEYYEKGLKASKEVNDVSQVATILNDMGTVLYSLGNVQQAIEYCVEAAKMHEKQGNKLEFASCLNNIGAVYVDQHNYEKGEEYYRKGLRLREEIKDTRGIAESYNNLGIMYVARGDRKEALEYLQHSLQLNEKVRDPAGKAYTLANIGLIYDDSAVVYGAEHLYPKALKYYEESLKIRESIGDKKGMGYSLYMIAKLLLNRGNAKEAESYAQRAIELGGETGVVEVVSEASNALSRIYSKTGEWKKAYEMQVLYKKTADSLSNESNRRAALQKGFQYEYEKKVSADSLKTAEERKVFGERMQKEKTQRWALYAGIVLIAVFSGFMYNRFRITRKQKRLIEIKERETQEQKQEIEAKHREISDSIHYAERIQRSFMATKELLDKHLPEYFVFFRPRDVVSGDFYWCAELINGNFTVATADSTGHGVPGAIMSLLNITSLEKAIEQQTQPDKILNHARTTIIERLKKDGSAEGGKDGMDCSLLVFDFKNMQLQIAAAYNPVWIIRNNSLLEIKADNMSVGKHDRDAEPFTLHTIDLQPGDTVYTLTDGFPDQFGGPKGKKFMTKNLKKWLLAHHHLPMQEQKELLEKVFRDWVGELEQIDDVTVIGIKI